MTKTAPLTPEEINNIFTTTCQQHQDGHLEKAKAGYLKLLDHVDAPLLHYNLGLVHFEMKEATAALSCFARAHAGNPHDQDTLFNLALSQKECGQFENACTSYLALLDLEPDSADARFNLAGCYRIMRKNEDAIGHYLQVLERNPDHLPSISNLAYMYQLIGETDMAVHYYQKLLQLDPSRDGARYMLDALQGNSSATPPDSYVQGLFDSYSDHYEQSLIGELNYNVPLLLREMLLRLEDRPQSFVDGIDLGCGTGLSGQAFADLVHNLDGIDLSPKMLALAEQKQIYNNLFVGNIISHLEQITKRYDFVLAADVFGYIGDLAPAMRLVSECTTSGGLFCLSIETNEEPTSFKLQPSGRFAHSPQYIAALADDYNWSVMTQQPVNLRRERNDWIKGMLWILRK